MLYLSCLKNSKIKHKNNVKYSVLFKILYSTIRLLEIYFRSRKHVTVALIETECSVYHRNANERSIYLCGNSEMEGAS